jgi:hypothetical protein
MKYLKNDQGKKWIDEKKNQSGFLLKNILIKMKIILG